MDYVIDLRSDTVTKPTKAMNEAMVNSALGDDVFKEDITVNALESKIAAMLGKEAALFVPTGTMGNLIALMVHCDSRGSEAFVGNLSHIYRSELGGGSHIAGILLSTLSNNSDGTFDVEELKSRIRGSKMYQPFSTMVAVENTHNYCGGKVLPLKFLDELSIICKKHSLFLHMDGARLFNACEYLQESPARVARDCDSISLCFSKGLSAPVGSALVGSCNFIEKARRIRKMLGGGMRQAGVLAGPAIVALDEVVPLLRFDHQRAKRLALAIQELSLTTIGVDVENQHTNIVIVKISPDYTMTADVLEKKLSEPQDGCKTSKNENIIVKGLEFNPKTLRLTLHREVTNEDLEMAIVKVTQVFKELDAGYTVHRAP